MPSYETKKPISVTGVGILFIVVGLFGFVYHVLEWESEQAVNWELTGILSIRLLAILGGVFLLRKANWAHWLLVCWTAYHCIISIFHTVSEFIAHILIFLIILYCLYNTSVSYYFSTKSRSDPN